MSIIEFKDNVKELSDYITTLESKLKNMFPRGGPIFQTRGGKFTYGLQSFEHSSIVTCDFVSS